MKADPMKKHLLLPFFILFIQHPLPAQTDSLVIKKAYRTWIIPTEKGQRKQGILFETKDSSLLISDKYKQKEFNHGNFTISKVDAGSIDVVKIREKGNSGKGILIGALSGLVVGGALDLIVFSSGSRPVSNTTEAGLDYLFGRFLVIIGSAVIVGAGTGIGAAIGNAKITIPINGSRKQYDHYKDQLNMYSVKYNPGLSILRDTVVDPDGNVYHTVAFGGQVWISENLRVTHYRNGESIPDISDSADWRQLTTGAYCNYKNDNNNANVYGRLYNWFAVNDSRKLCPAGWHVPSYAEWTSLINSLGGTSMAEKIMTRGAQPHPGSANKGAVTNGSFALLCGSRDQEGNFSAPDQSSHWWTATEQDSLTAQGLYLNYQEKDINLSTYYKRRGFSVRCIRDN
jgi:uncharacterized protein (TIGR02145 family)